MQDLVRREVIETAQTVVVKVGTNVLSNDDDTLNMHRLSALAEQLSRVLATGRKVVLVSSGAVGAGMGLLGLTSRPNDLPHLQATAATGQARLIQQYSECLKQHGYQAAQLLLTANDFKTRTRYINVRNTLNTLFEYAIVPIINENDTVSIDEIKFGDNDHLAAMVTSLLPSPLLVILSSVDGLFDGNPSLPESEPIRLVESWEASLNDHVADVQSSRGKGGMGSKLEAIRSATAVGENVILANGTEDNILDDILAGAEVGTLFLAQGARVPSWKRWIGYTVPPKGRFILDAGARSAIEKSGRSLLAVGIASIDGRFDKGEVVSLADLDGNEFARGLTNYDSLDLNRIVGKQTSDIETILGSLPYAEVVHRDNLVLI